MKSWQDLQRQQARRAATPVGTAAPSPQALAAAPFAPAHQPAAASPRLQALMSERAGLEQRMRTLSGQADATQQARRFPVASASERREEFLRWQAQRERPRGAGAEQAPATAERLLNRRSVGDAPALPWRGRGDGLREAGTPTSPSVWSQRRDARPTSEPSDERRPTSADADRPPRLRQVLDGAAQALRATEVLDRRQLDDRLDTALRRQLPDESSRRAARQGMDEGLRDLDRRLDGPKRQVQAGLARAREVLQAGERIERDWQARRDAIGGWDLARQARGYEARRHQLLEVATGSIAQLGERMDALRDVLQQRRAEQREQERDDEARRERARLRRQDQRAQAREDEPKDRHDA